LETFVEPRFKKSAHLLTALIAITAMAFVVAIRFPAQTAQAADTPDAAQIQRGAKITQTWCSGCHVTGAQSQRKAADIAPPFTDIANNKAISDARIRGVLTRPHGRMPTDALTTRQINDVVAYILSLRRTPR
jgi:mono/diheme cytochrome c family protein